MKIARDRSDSSIWIVRKELFSRYYSAYQLGSYRKIRFQKPYIDRYLEDPIATDLGAEIAALVFIVARRFALRGARAEEAVAR